MKPIIKNTFIYNKVKKTIIIPEGISFIPDEAFIDNVQVEEIIIPSSVTEIGKAAFKGCSSLKKIKLPNNLQILEDFAFSECTSLEEITIPTSLHYLSHSLFSYCYHLKTVHIHDNINYIDDCAFFHCKNLTHFHIPSSVTSIGKMAFMKCESIRQIYIHENVTYIEEAAFALMSSLEKITVHRKNKNYFSNKENTFLLTKDGTLLQYAIQNKSEELIIDVFIKHFTDHPKNDMELDDLITIYNIADFAFAGAKKLKRLWISSMVESIGTKTFYGCEQLKDLGIITPVYGNSFSLHITNVGNEEVEIPFEYITIEEPINTLHGNMKELFKNAKTIILPNGLKHIDGNIFSKSKQLKELILPPSIETIFPNTFFEDTILHFAHFGTIKAKDFGTLQTIISDNIFLNQERGHIQILSLNNGSYLVRINNFDIIKISQTELETSFRKNPVKLNSEQLILHLIHLLNMNDVNHNMVITSLQDPKIKSVFSEFATHSNCVISLAENKLLNDQKKQLEIHGIFSNILLSKTIIRIFNKEDLKKLMTNYNLSIERFFKFSKLTENMSINVDSLIQYCNLLEQYKQYNQFLYNPVFFHNVSIQNQELLIRYFNRNLKRLLINSETLDDLYSENLNDLLNLCRVLGIFSNDKIISQQMCMLLIEKIMSKNCPNAITKHKIHSIFNDLCSKEKLNYQFIRFFITNYQQLLEIEKSQSGIIVRIYHAFEDIQKVSTSNKGSGRPLMVTIDKCLEFFLIKHFLNVAESDLELANLLQKYYSEVSAFEIAKTILLQSKNAPRNIFTKVMINKNGEAIYSNSTLEDLEEYHEGFSYHWLPKQDYDNFLLGKYCNCCAHLLGEGAGIMRASMILDCCQNLVIKNESREIIAKMTIYVNREKGYAVFNTAEVNINYHDSASLKEIYEAFMRGVYAFIEQYNKNNKVPISIVTIGKNRNMLIDYFENSSSLLFQTPNYFTYGYQVNQKFKGNYNGDSKEKQIILFKK